MQHRLHPDTAGRGALVFLRLTDTTARLVTSILGQRKRRLGGEMRVPLVPPSVRPSIHCDATANVIYCGGGRINGGGGGDGRASGGSEFVSCGGKLGGGDGDYRPKFRIRVRKCRRRSCKSQTQTTTGFEGKGGGRARTQDTPLPRSSQNASSELHIS